MPIIAFVGLSCTEPRVGGWLERRLGLTGVAMKLRYDYDYDYDYDWSLVILIILLCTVLILLNSLLLRTRYYSLLFVIIV